MSFSDFLDMPMEPFLPNLLPEGSLFNSTFPPENPSIISTQRDIVALSSQLDQLSLETGTQSLRIELEKHKRQKLRTTIRQIKQNMISPCPVTASLKYEFDVMQRNQNAVNFQLEGEITTMRTITFRCLLRVHQLVTRLLPHVMLTLDDNFELVQMLHELSQTLH